MDDLIGIDKFSNLLFPLHQGNGVFHGTPVRPVQFVSVKHQSGSELLLGNSGNRKPT